MHIYDGFGRQACLYIQTKLFVYSVKARVVFRLSREDHFPGD